MLLVQVTNVDYDDIHHIKVNNTVEVQVSRLPEPIRFKRTYKLAGRRECGSNKLTIDETGLLTTLSNFDGEMCALYIEAGNCNNLLWEQKNSTERRTIFLSEWIVFKFVCLLAS